MSRTRLLPASLTIAVSLAFATACSEDPAAGAGLDAATLDGGDGSFSADLADRDVTDASDASDDAAQPDGDAPDGADDTSADGSEPDGADDSGTSDAATTDSDDAEPDSGSSPDAASPDSGGSDDVSFPDTPVDPYAPGPFRATRSDAELVVVPPSGGGIFGDPGVTLEIDVWVPEGDDPAPLFLFAPGFQLDRTNYRELGSLAASHGIIVLVPSFGDGAFSPIDHADLADYLSLVLDWALAQGAAGGNVLSGRIDPDWLVVGGHSRGGKIAFLTAINDDRFDATVTFDPVDSTGNPIFPPPPTPENPSVAPELMGDYEVPGLMFGAGRGGEGTPPCAPPTENFEAYWAGVTPSPFVLLVQAGAGHLDFATDVGFIADLGCVDGDTIADTRAYAYAAGLSFIRAVVLGDERYLPWADGTIAPAGTEVRTR
jgi:hypothetical protein